MHLPKHIIFNFVSNFENHIEVSRSILVILLLLPVHNNILKIIYTVIIILNTGEEWPGPWYKPSHADCPTSPEYSCRTRCKPVYPDVLQYPENGEPATTCTLYCTICTADSTLSVVIVDVLWSYSYCLLLLLLMLCDRTASTVTPGAETYEYDREFADNDNPSYSIAFPLPHKPNNSFYVL